MQPATPLQPPSLYGPGGGKKLKPSLMPAFAAKNRRAIHEALLDTLALARDLQQPLTCPPLSPETAVPANCAESAPALDIRHIDHECIHEVTTERLHCQGLASRFKGWAGQKAHPRGNFVSVWSVPKRQIKNMLMSTEGKKKLLEGEGLRMEQQMHNGMMQAINAAIEEARAKTASREELNDLYIAKECFSFVSPQEEPYTQPLDTLIERINRIIHQ
ncbi:unnamed protein product [Vitrella brassicaformis CCMP3155]|uniref:Uncharacterized protein n=1 Tax=Vitrella brassicaformis (strain CCMP3155) TaxID=1169540 RepID=A0A0G4EE13_VITBC|nr:unnamed protein product [Vitrella brassicaformis CCMP3155]|eukprot:CEL93569.1 unnamed protein product [Vitrella brassicaformis CCMP3155]